MLSHILLRTPRFLHLKKEPVLVGQTAVLESLLYYQPNNTLMLFLIKYIPFLPLSFCSCTFSLNLYLFKAVLEKLITCQVNLNGWY